MNDEMEALMKNQTWSLVPKQRDVQPISCKWVYKIKRRADGSIDRYKAKLVARGFSQKYGEGCKETFSPVAKMISVRVVLAMAASYGWKLWQLDVKNAFLFGELDKDIYMEQLPGLLLKFTWVNLVLASRMDLSNYLIFECQKLFVCSTRLHPKVERAVGVGFQPGLQPAKVVSAFQAGDIQFLDMRNLKEAYLTIDAHRGSLTSLVVHRHAPLIASGSSKKLYLNIKGSDLLSAETNGNQKNLFLHLSFLLAFSSYFFF